LNSFIGEYECKLDPKGRLIIPVSLKKQISPDANETFVVNRGFESHLNLFPLNEWKKIASRISRLNLFVKRNRDFIRKFNNGATELSMDLNSRILVPKSLLDYAGIDKDAVLFAYSNRIELWAKDKYERMLGDDAGSFSDLAEEVMGGINDAGNDDQIS
jgi:MraZ protein